MPIATRAGIEAVIGTAAVSELLRVAVDPSADAATRAAQAEARLAEALQAGDDLIAQFLPLPGESAEVPSVLRRFATDEALFYLQLHSPGGASQSEHEAARDRRVDLAHMRKRDQWTGSPKGQRSVEPCWVESELPFASHRLKGYL